MVRLMQVGERLHNYTISLLEPPRAFRFCSAAPAPHAKPCHDTSVPLSSTLTSLAQAAAKPFCLTAPPERRDRTTEPPTLQASFANDRNAQWRPGGATCDVPHKVDNTL